MNYIQTIGHTVIRLDVVDSTNNYAAKLLNTTNVLNGTVIMAKNQISGRGQKGNTWQTKEGENLTFSIVLNNISISSSTQFLISQWVSISIVEMLSSMEISSQIKWPNDILVAENKLKISGILIENSLRGQKISSSIIGVGLNVNQEIFPLNIKATSVHNELNEDSNLDLILEKLMYHLNANYLQLLHQPEKLHKRYFSMLIGSKDYLNYEDDKGNFSAKIENILPDGRLVLLDENDKKRIYMFKEVKLIL